MPKRSTAVNGPMETTNRIAGDIEKDAAVVISLRRLEVISLSVEIEGLTPLIPHRWSEKSLNQLREKQFGKTARSAREPKNPQEDAHQATYWVEEGVPGMPATAFK